KWILRGALIAALLVAAILLRGRDELPETPEAAVNALFDAATAGDDRAYLELTTGPLRTQLEENRRQMGAEGFRQSLKESVTGLLGLAVFEAPSEADDQRVLDVDLVFANRNERQRIVFVDQGSGWAILSIGTAAMEKPEIAYGTPVFTAENSPPVVDRDSLPPPDEETE
ncbi:MAG: hypothetical protein ACOY3P_19010, partial [Planctomycetota bacterium]